MSDLAHWFSLPFSWLRDIVDVLVVAFVVYRVLVMMRGTRAGQVLVGLFVILIAYLLSQSFELLALNWLMLHFINNLFLILVVLFQNEIRRALAQVGRGAFWGGAAVGEVNLSLEEVIRATGRLAAQRVGALIVLQRKTALGAIIETGTKLDAMVHRRLLEALFVTQSPLHDGAVVIDGTRIVAAACVLPLATEGDLPKEFGTRHRAALGLSLETDAVVIVVSEQRGIISLAYGGGIIFDLKPEELRGKLLELMGVTPKVEA